MDLEVFLSGIAIFLADKLAFFERLVANGGDAELFIGCFLERSNTGFTLSAKLQRDFAALGLALSFDLYSAVEDNIPTESDIGPTCSSTP